MKRFFSIIAITGFLLAAQTSQAQMVTLKGTSGLARDTITNADATSYKVGKTVNSQCDVFVKFTKLTGTVAGTVTWEVSNNNVDFAVIATDNLTDASKNFAHTFVKGTDVQAAAKFIYIRVTVTTTGTSTAWVEVNAWDHN